MKTICSTLLGQRCIKAQDPNFQWFQLRTILSQHRDALLNRVLADLPTYMEFKFHHVPSRESLAQIWEALYDLKHREVDMEYYEPILRQMQRRTQIKLNNDCFFLEIDESIRSLLPQELTVAA